MEKSNAAFLLPSLEARLEALSWCPSVYRQRAVRWYRMLLNFQILTQHHSIGKCWTSVFVNSWGFSFFLFMAREHLEAVLFSVTWSSNTSCQPSERCNITDSWMLFTEPQRLNHLWFKYQFSLLVKSDFFLKRNVRNTWKKLTSHSCSGSGLVVKTGCIFRTYK